MATFTIARASGALMLSAMLMGCSTAPTTPASTSTASTTSTARTQDRTPSWMKYQVSGSRIARRTDGEGNPITADFVRSTSVQELQMLPGVMVMPCSPYRRGC